MWMACGARAGRAGANDEPNVPLAGQEGGHGREATESHTAWSPRLGGACAPGPPPATSAVEDVLSPRGLRCPTDDCGQTPVVCGRSQFSFRMYVLVPGLCAAHANYHGLTRGKGLEKGDGRALTDRNERTGRCHGAARHLERQAVGPTTQARPRRRGPQPPRPPRRAVPWSRTFCPLLPKQGAASLLSSMGSPGTDEYVDTAARKHSWDHRRMTWRRSPATIRADALPADAGSQAHR